jgi:histidinol dehydrogenase
MRARFIGAHTPEAIGDYVAGSNHAADRALARFSSGLGVLDFMKRTSCSNAGRSNCALGPAAIALGEAEA